MNSLNKTSWFTNYYLVTIFIHIRLFQVDVILSFIHE